MATAFAVQHDLASSDSSPLSSPPLSDIEDPFASSSDAGIKKFLSKPAGTTAPTSVPASPQPRTRPPSPPHGYVLADNPDIAFVVGFASRFYSVLPKSLPSFGPQDIERGVSGPAPGELVESFLCAILSLVLNRKKPVEKGHYNRALEEAVHSHNAQWPRSWERRSLLSGGKTFVTLDAVQRLNLLKALVTWALSSSDAVQALLKESYKQVRREDDINQPLSIQPWGQDGQKRKYWLIEGQDDTEFRLYRESNTKRKTVTWWSVAGDVDELKTVAARLAEEGSQAARRLSERIGFAFPRLESSLEKRKKRDYRLARKAQFERRDPAVSLYEGRTRGKKLKYTFDTDDEDASDLARTRHSNRASVRSSKEGSIEPVVTTTASGRQVKSRVGGIYGESMLSGQARSNASPAVSIANGVTTGAETAAEEEKTSTSGRLARSRRTKAPSARAVGGEHIPGYNAVDEMEDEEEAASSGDEYAGDDHEDGDDDDDDDDDDDEDTGADATSDDEWDSEDAEIAPKARASKVVRLKVSNKSLPTSKAGGDR